MVIITCLAICIFVFLLYILPNLSCCIATPYRMLWTTQANSRPLFLALEAPEDQKAPEVCVRVVCACVSVWCAHVCACGVRMCVRVVCACVFVWCAHVCVCVYEKTPSLVLHT
jgi:hypothetical protein